MKNDQQSDRRFECVASGQSLQGEQFLQFAEHGAYLLCVDVLGFGPLVERSSDVDGLCGIINSLDAHRPDAFKTVVFPYTALSYTTLPPTDADTRQHLVMYLCEFAQGFVLSTGRERLALSRVPGARRLQPQAPGEVDAFCGRRSLACAGTQARSNHGSLHRR